MGTWRFTVGHKGVSRVTVFERPDSTSIFVEWFDDLGRHRQALSTVTGHPVTDRELAQQIARKMSTEQERKRNRDAGELLGLSTPRTLGELLARRHDDLKPTWTEKYAKDRERRRTFWLDHLGAGLPLTSVTPAVVERIVTDAQDGRSRRWRQDVLRYIVDSFIYAERKLKWIEPRHNLSAVAIPSAKGRSHAYTLNEARDLIAALWTVDPVAGWIGAVAFQTGRRLSAIRQLTPGQVDEREDVTVIRFPGDTDKARKTGEAVVVGLPPRTDWSVPSAEVCQAWIRSAEERAGIEHVDGRGWHGLKRLYATLTTNLPGADRQSGTRRETLEGHYRQDVLGPKAEVAKALAGHLAGQ